MDFQAVIESLDKNKSRPLLEQHVSSPIIEHANPYNALFPPTLARKPTLTNLVQQIKQQSSKTRFIKQYRKLLDDPDIPNKEDTSIQLDPVYARDMTNDQVEDLMISSRKIEKRPMKRRVYINESANQIKPPSLFTQYDEDVFFGEPQGDITIERFISMEKAIDRMRSDIELLNDEIEKEIKKINMNQEEIMKYKEEFVLMQTQFDAIQYALNSLTKDNLPDMKQQAERIQENEARVRLNKKKNAVQKYRFEKYRKSISIETRLSELDKKIKAAYRRDEIWAGIRDWGSFIVILLFMVFATILYIL